MWRVLLELHQIANVFRGATMVRLPSFSAPRRTLMVHFFRGAAKARTRIQRWEPWSVSPFWSLRSQHFDNGQSVGEQHFTRFPAETDVRVDRKDINHRL